MNRPMLTASAKLRAALDAKQAQRAAAERAAILAAAEARKAKKAKPIVPPILPAPPPKAKPAKPTVKPPTAAVSPLPEPVFAKKRRRRGARKPVDVPAPRALLAAHFPACFVPKGAPTKQPLKIGIYRDIRARLPELAARRLTAALNDYTKGAKYWTALVEGAVRIDLDGNPAGEVSADEAAHARTLWPRS